MRSWTWRSYRALRIGLWSTLLLGPWVTWNGIQNTKCDYFRMSCYADVTIDAPAYSPIAFHQDDIQRTQQTPVTPMNKERLQSLARDLRKTPPRSPRETLGGFVIAARMLDKARADLLGIHGEYNF